MKMEEIHRRTQKAKYWDTLCNAVQGFALAFFLLLLCGFWKPLF
jgi:hypothetical protein